MRKTYPAFSVKILRNLSTPGFMRSTMKIFTRSWPLSSMIPFFFSKCSPHFTARPEAAAAAHAAPDTGAHDTAPMVVFEALPMPEHTTPSDPWTAD